MSEGRQVTTVSPLERATSRSRARLLGLIIATSVLCALGGEPARLALRYERAAIAAGEWYRLVTGHFVHGSWVHLLMNVAGLGLIAGLFPRDYSVRQWLMIGAASLAVIDAGFVLFEPQLQWYVGLSGMLHGALAAGAVSWWARESRPLAAALSLILVVKLGWEQWRGALPLSGDMPVIVDAHLYGAVGGLIAGVGIRLYLHGWSAGHRSL